MARASKEADRLRRLCERSMKSPAPGAPPGASAAACDLASFDAPFFTRSTARGVLAAEGGPRGGEKRLAGGKVKRVKTGGAGERETARKLEPGPRRRWRGWKERQKRRRGKREGGISRG